MVVGNFFAMTWPADWIGWIGVIGSAASIVALPASVYAALVLRAAKRRVAFNAGAPKLVSKVKAVAKLTVDSLPNYVERKLEVRAELESLLAVLQYRKRELPEQSSHIISWLRTACETPVSLETADQGWAVYGKLLALQAVLEISQADRAVGVDDA
jgi:hypothetical protein